MSTDDELWEPGKDPRGGQDDELRRLESALARHRYAPRRWELPADAPAAGAAATAGEADATADAAVTFGEPSSADALAGSAADADEATDAPPRAPGSWWAAFARQGPGQRRRHVLQLLVAAALLLLLVSDVFDWSLPSGTDGELLAAGYELELTEGAVRVEGGGGAVPRPGRALLPGEVLVVDAAASARVSLGPEGWFELGERSRLHVQAAAADDEAAWRLYLERGELSASIFAAPRLFQLGTPSGIAVDLGCIYTATVGDDGSTRLTVRGGQVSFEADARKVFVPAGAVVVARPGQGPGTPTWEDGSPDLAAAVERLDAAAESWTPQAEQALTTVLAAEQPRDTLTLWHLLDHDQAPVRQAVYARLVALAPPPADVTEAGALSGDVAMLASWRDALERHWD